MVASYPIAGLPDAKPAVLAPRPVERRPSADGDATAPASAPPVATHAPIGGRQGGRTHAPRSPLSGLAARQAASFPAQSPGQDGDHDALPSSLPGRSGIGAYEAAARLHRPLGEREGVAILAPLSSGRAVDLTV